MRACGAAKVLDIFLRFAPALNALSCCTTIEFESLKVRGKVYETKPIHGKWDNGDRERSLRLSVVSVCACVLPLCACGCVCVCAPSAGPASVCVCLPTAVECPVLRNRIETK